MPIYTLINKETDEQWDEFFTSFTAKDEYLAENPHIRQKLVAPTLVSQHGGILSKTPDSWNDHLKAVKKGSGRSNTIKTK